MPVDTCKGCGTVIIVPCFGGINDGYCDLCRFKTRISEEDIKIMSEAKIGPKPATEVREDDFDAALFLTLDREEAGDAYLKHPRVGWRNYKDDEAWLVRSSTDKDWVWIHPNDALDMLECAAQRLPGMYTLNEEDRRWKFYQHDDDALLDGEGLTALQALAQAHGWKPKKP